MLAVTAGVFPPPVRITITPGARAPQNQVLASPATESYVTVPALTDGIYP